MSNLKDILTTISGILGSIGVLIVSLSGELAKVSIVLPDWAQVVAGICTAVSVVVIGFLQGKNADGTTKSVNQIINQSSSK